MSSNDKPRSSYHTARDKYEVGRSQSLREKNAIKIIVKDPEQQSDRKLKHLKTEIM